MKKEKSEFKSKHEFEVNKPTIELVSSHKQANLKRQKNKDAKLEISKSSPPCMPSGCIPDGPPPPPAPH